MKKGWLVGCGIAGIVGVGLCAGAGFLFFRGIFALTQPVVDASEQFLGLLGAGNTVEAYASTADGFRAQMDEASFTRAVEQLGLTEYVSATWSNRQFENQEGSAEGTVSTKDGGTKPVSVRVVQEDGRWKVVGVRYGGVELATARPALPLPAKADLERMVTVSLLDINKAFQAGDFSAFYDSIADRWKRETTPQQLQESLQGFIDQKIDLAPLENIQPQLVPPEALSDEGFLVATGHYPTRPSRVSFKLEYVQERDTWKLVGIKIDIAKAETGGE